MPDDDGDDDDDDDAAAAAAAADDSRMMAAYVHSVAFRKGSCMLPCCLQLALCICRSCAAHGQRCAGYRCKHVVSCLRASGSCVSSWACRKEAHGHGQLPVF